MNPRRTGDVAQPLSTAGEGCTIQSIIISILIQTLDEKDLHTYCNLRRIMKVRFAYVYVFLICLAQLVDAQNSEYQIKTDFTSDTWHDISLPFASNASSPSMAINPSGFPCIAYQYDSTGVVEIHYSEFNGTEWITTIIDSLGCGYPSLAFKSDGTPLVVGWSYFEEALNLYTFDGNVWTKMLIYQTSGSTNFSDDIQLCIDNNDLPHIIGYLNGQYLLFYSYFDGQSWQIKDDFGNYPCPDLTLDSNGNPYISHIDPAGSYSSLYCTFWFDDQWWTSVIDVYHIDRYATSIAISSDDFAHVAAQANGLTLTKDMGPGWLTEVVDQPANRSPDIKIDLNDNINIAYQDISFHDLRFARNTGSGWDIEVVDWEGNTGFKPSLAIDDQGRIYIAYTTNESSELGIIENGLQLIWFGSNTGVGEEYQSVVKPELHPIFPNPFSSSCTVCYQLDEASQVNLSVFDLSGKLVKTLVDQAVPAGMFSEYFDGSDLCSGIYLIRLVAGEHTASTRCIIIRDD